VKVSTSLRQEVLQKYGIVNAQASDYEIHYLIAPGLGGVEDIHKLLAGALHLQPLRSSVPARHPKLWFHRQTVAYRGNLYLPVQESPEFVYELHRRRQLIALTASAH
jgi:hypothetical protein